MLEVIDTGVLATIQDVGRPEAAALGVPRAGAADPLALAAANLLLGDDPKLPVIELTGGLPELLVRGDLVLAVTGADLGLRLDADGSWIRPGTSVLVRAGTTVRATTAPRTGLRTYLALAGGVEVPRVLGSSSTSPVGGFGGRDGRPLRAGDEVRAAAAGRNIGAGHRWPGPGSASGVPAGAGGVLLDVTDGPHREALRDVTDALLAMEWVVAQASDRVGLRLVTDDGSIPSVRHAHSFDSFALVWGAVEVPPDGSPIVMLPDGPTVGGYPVPLAVTSAHLPLLGQLRAGDRVRFRYLSPDEARAAGRAADAALAEARARLAVMHSVW